MSSDWEIYKQQVGLIKANIDLLYKQCYALTATCKCEETIHRKNISSVSRNKRFETDFDECVICLRIKNVKTKRVK